MLPTLPALPTIPELYITSITTITSITYITRGCVGGLGVWVLTSIPAQEFAPRENIRASLHV